MKDNKWVVVMDEEVQGKPVSVKRASFREKLWGMVSRGSAALYLGLDKSKEDSEPYYSHKSAMTVRPLVKRKKVILIFGLFIFLAVIIMLETPLSFLYNSFIWSLHLPKLDGIQAREDVTAAISLGTKTLTLATLLAAKMEEPHWEAMRSCLERAAQEFSEEPSAIQKNARMVLQCNGTKREFLSGDGGNLIEVVWIDGKVHYTFVSEASPDIDMARLGRHPLLLGLSSILGVLQDVASHNGSEELQGCLKKVLEEFSQEPKIVQDNAKLVVSCDGKSLTFISGEGKTEIIVFRAELHGEIQYLVNATGWAYWIRFF